MTRRLGGGQGWGAGLRLVTGGSVIDAATERRLASSRVLSDHLDYMRWCNLRPSTISQRIYALARFAAFIHHDVLDATAEEVGAFRDRLTRAGQPLAARSQRAELAHLRGFFTWACVVAEIRDDDPMLRVPKPKTPRNLPHPIPESELATAIQTARDRIRPFFLLAAFEGLRACEISPLRGEDIWWHASPPLIIIRESKGGDEQAVPLHPVVAAELERLPRRGWLFPKLDGSGPLKPHSISHLANEHLHRIGSSYTLHSCRHRFGTLCLRLSGGDLRTTQELMRHASPASTAMYTLVDMGAAAGVVNGLPIPTPLAVAS